MTVEQKIMSAIARLDMFITSNHLWLWLAIIMVLALVTMLSAREFNKHDRLR